MINMKCSEMLYERNVLSYEYNEYQLTYQLTNISIDYRSSRNFLFDNQLISINFLLLCECDIYRIHRR